jgi:hypothetical protein
MLMVTMLTMMVTMLKTMDTMFNQSMVDTGTGRWYNKREEGAEAPGPLSWF